MNYKEELNKANNFRIKINTITNGIVIPGNARSKVSSAYHHLTLEHFCSLIHLLNLNLYASSAALLRPQYEASMRGIYFSDYASDKALKNFISGEKKPTLGTIIGDITSKLEKKKESPFCRFFSSIETMMNEFTHGGMDQVNRRFTESELINNYSEKDKFILVSASLSLAKISFTCTLNTAGRKSELATLFPEVEVDKL
ncbi:DUF6988 family protein [Microbulbifer sp. TRSA005]|uniref:DUF6988 family protein n=1 Tax=Microbulbifer sp. TRSA005 TaxID=3243383 RepID=UPI004039D9F6